MSRRTLGVVTVLMLSSGGLLGLEPGVAAARAGNEVSTVKARGSTHLSGCDRSLRFEDATFPEQPRIDNPFLPMTPGTRTVLRGTSQVTGEPLDHEVSFTVTDLTKEIAGVNAVVVYDVDTAGGVVSEAELAFFAQDTDGNVWSLGEYPEEFEDGEFAGAPSTWVAGSGNAQAGIHMLADPSTAEGYYLQGWAPKIQFIDCASVVEHDATTTVLAGPFSGVLVTDEIDPHQPQDGSQQKYHAPGVGIVKVGFADDPEGEVLELAQRAQLDSGSLAQVRAAALAMDQRAYEESDVYQDTTPARVG